MDWPVFNIAGLSGEPAAAWAAVSTAPPAVVVLVVASIAESAVGAPAPSAAFLLHQPFVVPGAGGPVPAAVGASRVLAPASWRAVPLAVDISYLSWGCLYWGQGRVPQVEGPSRA